MSERQRRGTATTKAESFSKVSAKQRLEDDGVGVGVGVDVSGEEERALVQRL